MSGLRERRAFPAAAALLLLLLLDALLVPGFLELELQGGILRGALVDILHRGTPLLLVALGMTPVIATGGVDLSVGSAMALSSSLAAALCARSGVPIAAAAPAALLAGTLTGLANGALIAHLRVQPIVATLVAMTVGRGLAQLVSGGGILTFEAGALGTLVRGGVAGLPSSALLALALSCALAALLARTTLGLHVAAIGDRERAARIAGIRVGRVQCLVYGLSGTLAALAGLLVAGDVGAADASHVGLYLELDAILAVVIGGTPLAGGRANLPGTLLGALAIQALSSTMLYLNLGSEAALCVKAVLVLALVALGRTAARTAEARA